MPQGPHQPTRNSRMIAALCAVLGPVLVFALTAVALDRYVDEEEQRSIDNAGRVVNAVVTEASAGEVVDWLLEQHEPQVLLIGPSYANTDVRPELLAKRLGVPPERTLMLSIPNSVGAHWYAILKNRVFDAGYRPERVVVISGLQSMLLTTPLTEASYVNLTQHMTGEDEVLSQKVKRTTDLRMARLREKRGKLRASFFDVLRDVPPRLFIRSPKRPRWRMQPDDVRAALGTVFGDEQVDMSLLTRSMPVVETDRESEAYYDASMLPTPVDSLMPDITALATAHGAEITWVRPPMAPNIPAELDDIVPRGAQRAAIALVADNGGHFLDMRSLPMSATMFKNSDHMNMEGSRRFTEALARAMSTDADPTARTGPSAPLFGSGIVDGVRVDETVWPTWHKEPGRVPDAERPIHPSGNLGLFQTDRWHFLSDEFLMGETAFGSRCSPLRVTENGVLLERANVPCGDVRRRGRGRSCHTPEALFFASSDNSEPTKNGRKYKMVLADERRCDDAVWLYPADAFTVSWPAERLARLPSDATRFVLEGRYLQQRQAMLHVVLTADGRTLVDDRVDGRDLKQGPFAWTLDPPLPRDAASVQLQITNEEFVFYLLTGATLFPSEDAG